MARSWVAKAQPLDSELKELTDCRRGALSDGAAMDAATHA
jgi:hypothetical protein